MLSFSFLQNVVGLCAQRAGRFPPQASLGARVQKLAVIMQQTFSTFNHSLAFFFGLLEFLPFLRYFPTFVVVRSIVDLESIQPDRPDNS
jgi:hypothetical protein